MPQPVEAMFHRGDNQNRVDFTPGSAVANGKLVALGGRYGVCTSPEGIAAGVLGSLATSGVFKVKKAAGGGVTFAQGAKVFWHTTNLTAVTADGANIDYVGLADEAAADNDDHVKVDLNVAHTKDNT